MTLQGLLIKLLQLCIIPPTENETIITRAVIEAAQRRRQAVRGRPGDGKQGY
jgi:hypothetical protein